MGYVLLIKKRCQGPTLCSALHDTQQQNKGKVRFNLWVQSIQGGKKNRRDDSIDEYFCCCLVLWKRPKAKHIFKIVFLETLSFIKNLRRFCSVFCKWNQALGNFMKLSIFNYYFYWKRLIFNHYLYFKMFFCSSHCGTTELPAATWEHLDGGLIPSLAQWVKDPALLQLRLSSQLCSADPWPGSSICHQAAK